MAPYKRFCRILPETWRRDFYVRVALPRSRGIVVKLLILIHRNLLAFEDMASKRERVTDMKERASGERERDVVDVEIEGGGERSENGYGISRG